MGALVVVSSGPLFDTIDRDGTGAVIVAMTVFACNLPLMIMFVVVVFAGLANAWRSFKAKRNRDKDGEEHAVAVAAGRGNNNNNNNNVNNNSNDDIDDDDNDDDINNDDNNNGQPAQQGDLPPPPRTIGGNNDTDALAAKADTLSEPSLPVDDSGIHIQGWEMTTGMVPPMDSPLEENAATPHDPKLPELEFDKHPATPNPSVPRLVPVNEIEREAAGPEDISDENSSDHESDQEEENVAKEDINGSNKVASRVAVVRL